MRAVFALLLLTGQASAGIAADQPPRKAVIAVVIDDLGNSLEEGRRVVALPGAVACSILPHTIDGPHIADLAHAADKEVLLHLPMQSVADMPLGSGGITLEMTEGEIRATVADDLASIPHLAGMNNHEGSLITQHPGDMAWVLQTLHGAGAFYYIDSYTSADSVAYQIAREQQVPAARRNVFLDDVNTEAAVEAQWQRLIAIARHKGFALAIGHPRSATLKVLEEELPKLADEDLILVAPSEIVKIQEQHPLPDAVTIPSASATVKD
jgi:polysaccharide deacetylase 2 family uncharacterized protein YibQ